MRIAFLGLGKMGTPMARRLVAAGHDVTVWNRTRARADVLAAEGARVAATPDDAARAAEVVMTMLFDENAHEEILLGPKGLLEKMRPGTLHISHSTIGVALSGRFTAEHARRGQEFVAAPVFGRPEVAEAGRLWVVVAGAEGAVNKARPLLEPLSRGISVVGAEPRQAHALKLGGNFLITCMNQALSEAFVYAASQGIDPAMFFETVNSALFQSAFMASYCKLILHPPEQPGGTVELGAKDLRLLREAAASSGTRLSLADMQAEIFAQALQLGLGGEDWAGGQYHMAQRNASVK